VSVPTTPTPYALGFLSIVQDSSGLTGGYLVTNAWGRPLEFRHSTAVQPTKVQQILYGPTLTEYLHAELIGKTLLEKSATPPALVVTDSLAALALRSRINVPVVAVQPNNATVPDVTPVLHARSSVPLLLGDEADRDDLLDRLDRIDPAVDLAEPFARIREAMAEVRKLSGVNGRAA
jgi:hypothetical protein